MKSSIPYVIHTALIGCGALAMVLSARSLHSNEALDHPVNPLGICRSPYGEVFAMAMQTPIDGYWYQGELAKHAPVVASKTDTPEKSIAHGSTSNRPWNQRLTAFLEKLETASTARTNPIPGSKAYDRFVRSEVESKLRVAYRLDPAHYGNYNSYHFFLTEPAVGTRPVLTPEAAQLARETIKYCFAEPHDPRPSLTAAAAATNILHLLFEDQRSESKYFTPEQMRETLNLLDAAIQRHHALRQRWFLSGDAELASPMRIAEMEDRLKFVTRIRDDAEQTIINIEQEMTGKSVENNYNRPNPSQDS